MSTSTAALAAEKPRTANGRRRAERLGVEERRQQLLELGVRIVATRRYEEPWLEEVARTADISKGLIYHYFDTKRGFYVEILRFIAQSLAKNWSDSVTPLIKSGAAADDVTDAGLEAYLTYAQSYPAAFRTLIEAGGGIDPAVKRVDGYLREEIIRHVAHYYGKEDLPPLARASIKGWAAFAEQISLEWLDGKDIKREEVVKVMRSLMRALFPATL
jgi:AcrR family transcriptional regulator